MNKKILAALALLAASSIAAAGPRGIEPKSSANLYPIHAEKDGVSVGALLLTSAEVRKTFVSDVNRCCLVVEIAVYPVKDKTQQVSLNDFSLHVVGPDKVVKPSTAKTVAGSIHESIEALRNITVSLGGHRIRIRHVYRSGYRGARKGAQRL